jgi:1-acyl-sn-glycerol-3-phosphate acyltransferase
LSSLLKKHHPTQSYYQIAKHVKKKLSRIKKKSSLKLDFFFLSSAFCKIYIRHPQNTYTTPTMTFEAYDILKASFKVVTKIFFREVRTSGANSIPTDGPCIFLVAPHANQFIDPGMVLISNPRQFAPLMAQTSFKMKIVGTAARLLHASKLTDNEKQMKNITCFIRMLTSLIFLIL